MPLFLSLEIGLFFDVLNNVVESISFSTIEALLSAMHMWAFSPLRHD